VTSCYPSSFVYTETVRVLGLPLVRAEGMGARRISRRRTPPLVAALERPRAVAGLDHELRPAADCRADVGHKHDACLALPDSIGHAMDAKDDDVKLPCSRSALDKLGERLCAEQVAEDDMDLLSDILVCYDECLARAEVRIRQVVDGFASDEGESVALTTRVKTTGTIREKLKREHGMGLKGMRDIAGVRVSGQFTRRRQDRLRDLLMREFAGGTRPPREIDRRANPSFGYRAVHVVVHVGGLPVEVQIRTQAQDSWAQTVERLGDAWGRGIRYGQPPEDPDRLVSGGLTRDGMLRLLMDLSDILARMEEAEAETEQEQKELDDLERSVESMSGHPLDQDDMLGRVQELKDRKLARVAQKNTIVGVLGTLDALSSRAEGWRET
jgi:ppGpp synthetase/RelA/SpoT-type nucleotidyltranferase